MSETQPKRCEAFDPKNPHVRCLRAGSGWCVGDSHIGRYGQPGHYRIGVFEAKRPDVYLEVNRELFKQLVPEKFHFVMEEAWFNRLVTIRRFGDDHVLDPFYVSLGIDTAEGVVPLPLSPAIDEFKEWMIDKIKQDMFDLRQSILRSGYESLKDSMK